MSLEVCVCVCEAGPGPGSLAASYFRYQSNYQLSLDCNNPCPNWKTGVRFPMQTTVPLGVDYINLVQPH